MPRRGFHPGPACRFESSSSPCLPRWCSRRRYARSSVACDAPGRSQRDSPSRAARCCGGGSGRRSGNAGNAADSAAGGTGCAARTVTRRNTAAPKRTLRPGDTNPVGSGNAAGFGLRQTQSLAYNTSVYHILVLPNRHSGVEGVVTRRFTARLLSLIWASAHPDPALPGKTSRSARTAVRVGCAGSIYLSRVDQFS